MLPEDCVLPCAYLMRRGSPTCPGTRAGKPDNVSPCLSESSGQPFSPLPRAPLPPFGCHNSEHAQAGSARRPHAGRTGYPATCPYTCIPVLPGCRDIHDVPEPARCTATLLILDVALAKLFLHLARADMAVADVVGKSQTCCMLQYTGGVAPLY